MSLKQRQRKWRGGTPGENLPDMGSTDVRSINAFTPPSQGPTYGIAHIPTVAAVLKIVFIALLSKESLSTKSSLFIQASSLVTISLTCNTSLP